MSGSAALISAVISASSSLVNGRNGGENGFLIEPKNVSQLIEKLKTILSGEIDLKIIEKNARKTIEEKFNLRDYIEKLEKIYREIEG